MFATAVDVAVKYSGESMNGVVKYRWPLPITTPSLILVNVRAVGYV
jgi:hypothetical protein